LAKKNKIYDLLSFVNMPKRNEFLQGEGLSEEQLRDIDNVIAHLPYDVKMNLRCEVDEDDESVGITGNDKSF
jgi:hypothetical protein